jgi:hypothetical protein
MEEWVIMIDTFDSSWSKKAFFFKSGSVQN